MTAFRSSDGEWTFEPKVLKSEAIAFFQKLYGEVPSLMGSLPTSGFSQLEAKYIKFPRRPVSNEEIECTLFDMDPLKALGSDSLHALFFQRQWETIGKEIYEWIRKFFTIVL
ncbi:hypothetical protein V6Z11_A11G290000 [Gossypium hirsutum]